MTIKRILAPLCLVASGAGVAQAQSTQPVTLNIDAQPVRLALQQFGAQAGVQVLMRLSDNDASDVRISPVKGEYTVTEGLDRLLARTGLKYEFVNDKAVRVAKVEEDKERKSPQAPVSEGSAPAATPDTRAPAQSDAPERSSDDTSASSSVVLEQIVVSAQKRGDERLQDVPIPVSVIDAAKLADNGQVLLREYYSSVPGLNIAPNYLARQQLSIRGVMTGGNSNPTVGITVDDVPFGASTDITGGGYVPDIDTGDLARVEVLRGPQGTLYGANSMGGLIRYVMLDPSFSGYSGRVEAGTYGVRNGNEPGYHLRAAANVPLSDSLAMRVSGFTRQDAGYVDNPVTRIDGVNRAVASGGMLAALWQPSEDFSLKLSALYQNVEADGSPEVQTLPGLGDLQQGFLARTRGYERTVQAYSALVKAKLGRVDLTSVTGYTINDQTVSDDRSSNFQAQIQSLFGVTGARYKLVTPTKKISQELRLSDSVGKLDWQIGGFYMYEDGPGVLQIDAENVQTGQSAGLFLYQDSPRWAGETAAFGSVTWHFTDRFDVQIGGRQSRQKLVMEDIIYIGPFTMTNLGGQPSPFIDPRVESRTNAFTYLVTPTFKVSPDLMVYGRFASGYRPGGPNGFAAQTNGAPSKYEPDKTQNYELGIKADLLDHRLSIDASVYYIDWQDIQIGFRIPAATYSANGGGAKSQGVELSTVMRPTAGLSITAWATWNDAVLTEAFPATSTLYGASGDRLPFATKYSAYLSLQQEFPLWGAATGFVGGAINYVGDRVGLFQPTALRQNLPSYVKTDLRAGVSYDSWAANLFVNNLADKRGLINGGIGYIPGNTYAYIQPRTIGVSLSKTF